MSRNSRYIFYSKSFMIQVFNPFWFAFCVWYKIVVQSHSFACGCTVYQQHLSKRLLCPLCIVGSLGTYVSQSVSSVTQSCLTLCYPMNAAHQASLSITNSWSLLTLMPIKSVMPSSHLILCRPLLLLPSIPPSIRDFSSESALRMRWPNYWSFSFSISMYICMYVCVGRSIMFDCLWPHGL